MKFLTQEDPGKVVGLLGTSMVSMFFLFAVCVTNANFTQTEKAFPDPFNPTNVVAMLDVAASGYNNFVDANLVQPAKDSYAVYQYNLDYVIAEASPSILAMTGLSDLASAGLNVEPAQAHAQVAGDSTQVVYSDYYKPSSGGVFSVFFGN